MPRDPTTLLAFNAALQIFVSSVLGVFMLLPMQPWGRALRARVNAKALLATHLDWLMLAFMQLGAAFIFSRWPVTAGGSVAWMLVFGGWVNPLPYLVRGFGIDAFVFAGPPVQRLAAAVAGASVAAIVAAWALILYRFPI
ncbi:MAG TPA: hypothetical protein VKU41_14360 [Polyangiaceae bacterium]|nr:hypothetical protein [Polyangiaceae bacterium]